MAPAVMLGNRSDCHIMSCSARCRGHPTARAAHSPYLLLNRICTHSRRVLMSSVSFMKASHFSIKTQEGQVRPVRAGTPRSGGRWPLSTHRMGVLCFLRSCLTLCDPMDCSPPGSSVHGILQARILEGVATPSSSRGSSRPRDRTHVSCTAGGFFTLGATWETPGPPHEQCVSCRHSQSILGLS